MTHGKSFLNKLRHSVSGIATTELALSLPFLLAAGLGGVELANYGVATMRINQLAVHMADNASRIGDTSTLENRKIYEADINDLLLGSHIQSGKVLRFFDNGRVIISSLEVDGDDDQYIHWQRCMGRKNWTSSYGNAGDRLADGMGPDGRKVISFDDEAVMFVELAYDYQPLVSSRFVGSPVIKSIASFTVRADRDLSQIYQRDTSAPDPVADCARFDNPLGPIPDFGAGGGGAMGGGNGGGNGSSGGGNGSSGGGNGSSGGGNGSSGGGNGSSGGRN